MFNEFIIVRHGATEWSVSGQYTGRTDLALTERGEAEAVGLGPLLQRVADVDTVTIRVSPLRRAQMTARIALGPGVADRWTVDDALAEWDYGAREGLTKQAIAVDHPSWELFNDGAPNGESLDDVARRCDDFLDRVDPTGEGTLMVFCHGHLSRILTCRILGLDPSIGRLLRNDTASVSIIRTRSGQRFLHAWNLTAR